MAPESEVNVMQKQIRMWQAAIGMAVMMAGGGGAGTYIVSAQTDERLRATETQQATLANEVKHIRESIISTRSEVKENQTKINDIDKKVDRSLVILESIKDKVDE